MASYIKTSFKQHKGHDINIRSVVLNKPGDQKEDSRIKYYYLKLSGENDLIDKAEISPGCSF